MLGSHGLSARRARRTKSRGPKGLQLEVGARRASKFLVEDNGDSGDNVNDCVDDVEEKEDKDDNILCFIWLLVPSSMTVIMAPVLHWTLTKDNAFVL